MKYDVTIRMTVEAEDEIEVDVLIDGINDVASHLDPATSYEITEVV